MARILVVFSSLFGANAELAGMIRPVLARSGAETRLRGVAQHVLPTQMVSQAKSAIAATGADLEWADGFIFTSQIHTGMVSASMKAFIDEQHDAAETGAFLDKTFTAMATGAYDHAGHEHVVDELNMAAAVWGCLLVPPSGADAAINHLNGNPWGLSFGLRHGRLGDRESAAAVLQAHLRRFAAVTDVMAAARATGISSGRHPRRRVSSQPQTPDSQPQPHRESGSMNTPNNPLRATQIFTGPGSRPGSHSSSRGGSGLGSGSSGQHSPDNPLRATQIFTGPSYSSSGGEGSGSGTGSPGSGSRGSGSRGRSGSGGGHSPTNPLRASDVFGPPRKDR